MTVVSFKEIHNGRDGEDAYRSGNVITRYTRIYRAVTDSNSDNAATILAWAACPRIGWVFPSDPRAFCQSVQPRNEPFSKKVWIVTAGYSTERELSDSSPMDDPAKFTWDTEEYQRVFYKDRDGNAILNAAGDPFDPPVEGDDSRLTVNLQANLANIPVWWASYRDAVNSTAIVIDGYPVAAGNSKISRMSLGDAQERNGIAFRMLTAAFQIDEDGWTLVILNQGLRCRDPDDNTKRVTCSDENGDEVIAPVQLDAVGDQIETPTPASATYIEADIYNAKDFTVFPGIVAGSP